MHQTGLYQVMASAAATRTTTYLVLFNQTTASQASFQRRTSEN